jgi:transposase-like protein
MDFPRTQLEFEQRFASEADCIAYLRRLRWPSGFQCPRCGCSKAWQLAARPLDQCASCRHQVSLTAGTLFQRTRKPLLLWFRVIGRFVTSKSGCSALEISRLFGLNYETAWVWLHKIRSLMDRENGSRLQGLVEADETIVGGRKEGFRGRELRKSKVLVLGAVERTGRASGRLRLAVAACSTAAAIATFIGRSVERTARIRTDGLHAYRPLRRLGFDHEWVKLSDENFQGGLQRASVELPGIHRAFALLQRWLLGTYHGGISRKHLHAYTDEFVFRFNRRRAGSPLLLVQRVLEASFRRVPCSDAIVSEAPQLLGVG